MSEQHNIHQRGPFAYMEGPTIPMTDHQMSLDELLELDIPIPVYFEDLRTMMAHFSSFHYERASCLWQFSPIGRRLIENALVVDCIKQIGADGTYRDYAHWFVYVRGSYTGYRAAIAELCSQRGLLEYGDPLKAHVDHVLNRKSVSNFRTGYFLICWVEKSMNSLTGSRLERQLNGTVNEKVSYLKPWQAWKIFGTRFPKDENEFERNLRDLFGKCNDSRTWQWIAEGTAEVLGYKMPAIDELNVSQLDPFKHDEYYAGVIKRV